MRRMRFGILLGRRHPKQRRQPEPETRDVGEIPLQRGDQRRDEMQLQKHFLLEFGNQQTRLPELQKRNRPEQYQMELHHLPRRFRQRSENLQPFRIQNHENGRQRNPLQRNRRTTRPSPLLRHQARGNQRLCLSPQKTMRPSSIKEAALI